MKISNEQHEHSLNNSGAYSVTSFCDAHHISRAYFYQLIKKGQAPRLMKLGRRTLISNEAAAEWRKGLECA